MTFDPRSFLDLATKLLYDQSYDEDARYRTCISRAYYAAHLFTKEKLKEIGVTISIGKDERKGVIHDKVIDALTKKNKPLGEMLTRLRDKRGDADYVLNAKFVGYGIGLDITNAEYVIDEVDKLKILKK
jgi:uncharacterized protein (UPF0332 family)